MNSDIYDVVAKPMWPIVTGDMKDEGSDQWVPR